jgi:hypothetical protein
MVRGGETRIVKNQHKVAGLDKYSPATFEVLDDICFWLNLLFFVHSLASTLRFLYNSPVRWHHTNTNSDLENWLSELSRQ